MNEDESRSALSLIWFYAQLVSNLSSSLSGLASVTLYLRGMHYLGRAYTHGCIFVSQRALSIVLIRK